MISMVSNGINSTNSINGINGINGMVSMYRLFVFCLYGFFFIPLLIGLKVDRSAQQFSNEHCSIHSILSNTIAVLWQYYELLL